MDRTEVTDALLALLLLVVSVILMLVVSYNTTPGDEIMQRWAKYDKEGVLEYQEKQDWYFYSFNQ